MCWFYSIICMHTISQCSYCRAYGVLITQTAFITVSLIPSPTRLCPIKEVICRRLIPFSAQKLLEVAVCLCIHTVSTPISRPSGYKLQCGSDNEFMKLIVQKSISDTSEVLLYRKHICDRICEKGSYSLSNWMHLIIHCVTCEYGTNLKFGNLTVLTWFYSWQQLYINRLNTL